MIVKLAVAGALALASLPGGLTKEDFGPDVFVSNPYVAQVSCERSLGTAFKIATGQWVTVDHVSSNGGCRVNGLPIFVITTDPEGDFSVIDFGDRTPGGLPVDCDGFHEGEWYYGIGFGWGLPVPQVKAVRHTAYPWLLEPNWNRLDANRFVPGMSGGPVLDSQNRVVGTVNAYGMIRISFSRALKDTVICKGAA